MKIIWIYRVLADGNTHITTWRETYRHLKRRHEIHYIFPYKSEPRCFADHAVLIEKKRIPVISFLHFLFASFMALRRLNRSLRPDVIVLDQFTAFFALPMLVSRRRPALVLDLRQAKYSNEARWFSGTLFRLYTRWVLKFNRRYQDGISFISEGLRAQLLRDMSMPLHPNYLVWPSGVDPQLFDPRAVPTPTLHGKSLRLFFHGSVTDDRGLAETVRALALLQASNVDATFTVVGDGSYLPSLKRLADELGVADRMEFHELVPYEQVPALIATADVCMMAYPINDYWEGNVPIKILEYLAMEKMVLCTRLNALKTIVGDAPCACFIESNDPERIAAALRELNQNRDSLAERGRSGRELVRARYSWEAISADIDRFLTDTVQAHRRTP